MIEEDNNLDKVLEYTAKVIECRQNAKNYDNGSLSKYTLEATARIYEEMANKEVKK